MSIRTKIQSARYMKRQKIMDGNTDEPECEDKVTNQYVWLYLYLS
jgi:hypothetical protein